MKKGISLLFLILCLVVSAHASREEPGVLDNWVSAMDRTVRSPTDLELYRPLHIHHMRWNYSREQISKYNEHPGGFGLGLSRAEGRYTHTLYALGFTDSNYYFQGVLGYAWLASVFETGSFFNVGGGFTISAHLRHEYHYIPIPLPLPLAGVEVGPVALQGAYVPGWHGMGNVALFWVKLKIPLQ